VVPCTTALLKSCISYVFHTLLINKYYIFSTLILYIMRSEQLWHEIEAVKNKKKDKRENQEDHVESENVGDEHGKGAALRPDVAAWS
jgi:hypothetical protein